MKTFAAMLSLLCAGCVGLPDDVKPVEDFKVEKYLGTWYEIARLDHSFERGLSRVTATYSMREDGGVKVLNRGFVTEENKWKEAEGKAYFVNEPTQGFLKVSFFGPFYGSYIVMELDKENYQYSLVCGPKKSYLWILSRTPKLSDDVKSSLIAKAKAAEFETEKLIFVDQEGAHMNDHP